MGPVKRSIMIAGHATSISLEPVFWEALRGGGGGRGAAFAQRARRVGSTRRGDPRARPRTPASAIRMWLFERERANAG